jgi:16S rRNA (cytosine967-C5)-methyltransferase
LSPGLTVRKLAIDILKVIIEGKSSFDEALESMREAEKLDPRDRGFLMTLVLTTLRRKGEADAVTAVFLNKPLPAKSGIASLILALGAVQLLFLDQPPHAVIDLAVRLAKSDPHALHFSGLINAVLRKVAERGKDVWAGLDGPRLNTRDWLWNRWVKTYGAGTAHGIAAQHMIEPELDLTVPRDNAQWAERLGGMLLPTGTVRLAGTHGSIENLAGYNEGAWWVQDAASALPARLLGDPAGKSVLDLCAAPGGKTLQLCAMGAKVTALDSSAKRLERLTANLTRCQFQAEVIVADAESFDDGRRFDAVLLDAPCSATGTIRRHPDLPWLKTEKQLRELAGLQRRLLKRAATLVKPGGTLIYCTCSLEPEEGEKQITSFLGDQPGYRIVPMARGESGTETAMITGEGFLRTLPHMRMGPSQGLDGFFAARLMNGF